MCCPVSCWPPRCRRSARWPPRPPDLVGLPAAARCAAQPARTTRRRSRRRGRGPAACRRRRRTSSARDLRRRRGRVHQRGLRRAARGLAGSELAARLSPPSSAAHHRPCGTPADSLTERRCRTLSPWRSQALQPRRSRDRPGRRSWVAAVLGVPGMVVFGLSFMVPIAPFGVFGSVFAASGGQVVGAYLVGAAVMALTACSFVVMAREYTGVGSVHTFVGRAVGPVAGFLAGWMLLLDYLLVPALIALVTANGLHAAVPAVPAAVWIIGLVLVATVLNLVGIARVVAIGAALLVAQLAVVAVFVAAAVTALGTGATRPGQPLLAPLLGPAGGRRSSRARPSRCCRTSASNRSRPSARRTGSSGRPSGARSPSRSRCARRCSWRSVGAPRCWCPIPPGSSRAATLMERRSTRPPTPQAVRGSPGCQAERRRCVQEGGEDAAHPERSGRNDAGGAQHHRRAAVERHERDRGRHVALVVLGDVVHGRDGRRPADREPGGDLEGQSGRHPQCRSISSVPRKTTTTVPTTASAVPAPSPSTCPRPRCSPAGGVRQSHVGGGCRGISQPSASERMSAFGRRLGRTLLDRSRRGSALTPSGGVVCGWAQRVLDQMTVLFDGVATLRREWRREGGDGAGPVPDCGDLAARLRRCCGCGPDRSRG